MLLIHWTAIATLRVIAAADCELLQSDNSSNFILSSKSYSLIGNPEKSYDLRQR